MHFTAATALAVLAAAQPALAVVDFHMGTLVWGSFGTPAKREPAMILDKEGGHACDALSHKLLESPVDGANGGNWNCDDCGTFGSDIKGWSPTNFQVDADKLDTDSKYVTVRKNNGDWRVFDDSNRKLGECTEQNGSMQKCVNGLDVYTVFRFMRCEGIART